MSTFLERSAALRVDMLTSLFGLASLLLLMNGRCAKAGVAVAASFLISQKAVFYVLAGSAALGVHFLIFERNRARARDLFAYLSAAFLVLIAYLGFWSSVSSVDAVMSATFLSHYEIAFTDLYDLNHYWRQTISRNSFFYAAGACSAVALLMLTLRGARSRPNNILLVYAFILTAFCAWHRQPWPYFFVILIPTVFVVTVPGFERLLSAPEFRRPIIRRSLTAGYVLLGLAYPLLRVPTVLSRDNTFQRHMVRLADSIVLPGETYLAGVDLLYDRTDVPTSLVRLDRARLRRLGAMEDAKLNAVIANLEAAPVKLLVNNYRLDRLPPALNVYLKRHYRPLWGNLEIYAPRIEPSQRRFLVRFNGTYAVEMEGSGAGRVNDQVVEAGTRITLRRGEHVNDSQCAFRLRFAPAALELRAKPEFRQARKLFAQVYSY